MYKRCPRCETVTEASTAHCVQCGHAFRTVVAPPVRQGTQFLGGSGGFSNPPVPGGFRPSAPSMPQMPPAPGYGMPHGHGGAPAGNLIIVPPGQHPVAIVAVLSVMFGGWLGAIVNKQVVKGLVMGMLYGAFWLTMLMDVLVSESVMLFYLATSGVWLAMLIDAIKVANRLNQGLPVKEWDCF
jgi:hypothetical protein